MNRLEHLLTIFIEECNEVAQETSKALRFGVNEQRDLPTSNLERMQKEFNQLMAMRDMLWDEGVCIRGDQEVMYKKRITVEKYLLYSAELHNHTEEDMSINIIIANATDGTPDNVFVEIENDAGESILIGEELTTDEGYRKIRISTSDIINHQKI